MYKCERCKGQVKSGIPQARIYHYKNKQIKSEEKVCFHCKKFDKGGVDE